uniref:Uncharacterized protein n=1 Tax=Plectus sambesii TaxID=2011161 RepID=A0A914W0L7_9BILA
MRLVVFICTTLLSIANVVSGSTLYDHNLAKTITKRRSGFGLAELENNQNAEGLDPQENCRQKCNSDLLQKLDEVKVYGGFGNLGLPDTFDKENLDKFCRADREHDDCIVACGYLIQFNVRDYVCKTHYSKMLSFLPCYKQSATELKAQCEDEQCGQHERYAPNMDGYAKRCNRLLCNLKCASGVLTARCVGRLQGKEAAQFLTDFTNYQVNTWSLTSSAQMVVQGKTPVFPTACVPFLCTGG